MIEFLNQLFRRKDYMAAYSNARSEAVYLEQKEFSPKYSTLKRIATNVTIYLLFMSVAYGIAVTRELAELRGHLNIVLSELHQINETEYEKYKTFTKRGEK